MILISWSVAEVLKYPAIPINNAIHCGSWLVSSHICFVYLPQDCVVPAMMRGISIAQDRAVPHGLPQTFRP